MKARDGANTRGSDAAAKPTSRRAIPILYRKGKTASELRYMGHTLTDNRHGLVVNAMVTQLTALPNVKRPRP